MYSWIYFTKCSPHSKIQHVKAIWKRLSKCENKGMEVWSSKQLWRVRTALLCVRMGFRAAPCFGHVSAGLPVIGQACGARSWQVFGRCTPAWPCAYSVIRLLEAVENVRLGEKQRHAFQGYQIISWFCWTHEVLIKQWDDFCEKLQFVSQIMTAYVERPYTQRKLDMLKLEKLQV